MSQFDGQQPPIRIRHQGGAEWDPVCGPHEPQLEAIDKGESSRHGLQHPETCYLSHEPLKFSDFVDWWGGGVPIRLSQAGRALVFDFRAPRMYLPGYCCPSNSLAPPDWCLTLARLTCIFWLQTVIFYPGRFP